MTSLEQLHAILHWYEGCLVCDETLANINRELAPLGLVAHFDGDIIVVRAKPRAVPSKPRRRIVQHQRKAEISPCPV